MHIGSLGDVVFETSYSRLVSLVSFQGSSAARFEDHQVIGASPRTEYLAPELDSIDLSVVFRWPFVENPALEAAKLVTYCKRGKVVPFIITGYNLGKHTVRSVKQDWKYLAQEGVQIIKCDLTIMEYY